MLETSICEEHNWIDYKDGTTRCGECNAYKPVKRYHFCVVCDKDQIGWSAWPARTWKDYEAPRASGIIVPGTDKENEWWKQCEKSFGLLALKYRQHKGAGLYVSHSMNEVITLDTGRHLSSLLMALPLLPGNGGGFVLPVDRHNWWNHDGTLREAEEKHVVKLGIKAEPGLEQSAILFGLYCKGHLYRSQRRASK